MAGRGFKDLLGDFPRAHLIVGHVESLKATATAEAVIGRLIENLGPRADWATGQMQDGARELERYPSRDLPVHLLITCAAVRHGVNDCKSVATTGHRRGPARLDALPRERITGPALHAVRIQACQG
jgi:hypothetical protein